jgi:hypothetical protein
VEIIGKIKVIIAVIIIIVVSIAMLKTEGIAENYYGLYGLITFNDDYLNNDFIDTNKTDAYIDNDYPGTVTLPKSMFIAISGQKIIAPHPKNYEYYIITPNKVVFYAFDGDSMQHISQKDILLQNAVSATYSQNGDFLFVGHENTINVYGFGSDGKPQKIMSKGTSSLIVSLDTGFKMDFWVLLKNKALYYMWNGSDYIKTFEIQGFTDAKSFSFSPERNALAVLDSDKIRYFMFNGQNYVEIPEMEISQPNMYGVVMKENGDYIIFSWDGTQYYAISTGKSEYISELSDPLVGIASITDSKWSKMDYIAITPFGLLYRAFNGEEYITNYSLSIEGAFGSGSVSTGMGYSDEAELISVPIQAKVEVDKLVIKPIQEAPPGTSIKYQVSTDKGNTWIMAEPNVPVGVPPGNSITYRIVLKSTDPALTPSVDKVQILQIGSNTVRAETLGQGRIKIRLVK